MSKRKRVNSIEKKIKDNRGIGIGIEYKPWLNIQDVSSLGRSTRLKGIKTKRQHEFLSDLERNYFYLLEYSDVIEDIREQYPLLPIEDTLLIADELGIVHPKNPKTGEPIVMTTDFLITCNDAVNRYDRARTVKSKADLLDSRVLEKLEIERVYWERAGIDWAIVTEEEINKTMALNISFVHNYHDVYKIDGFESMSTLYLEDLKIEYISRMIQENESIRTISHQFDHDFDLMMGSGLSIFRHLVINKVIEVDFSEKLNMGNIIPIKAIREDFSEKVNAI